MSMSVFYVKIAKVLWQLGATPPDPWLCPPLCQFLGTTLSSIDLTELQFSKKLLRVSGDHSHQKWVMEKKRSETAAVEG